MSYETSEEVFFIFVRYFSTTKALVFDPSVYRYIKKKGPIVCLVYFFLGLMEARAIKVPCP